ncbi:predicted protein [Chaetoceros tenuissimus]|uniref:Uncharacterized protein n=1 Tax=Chaetoceros tenuissimus TaxID=426638 RepID=A0AAD3HBP0_9STRA|nr:predicted protein [Chaetoceros tenuissimus]
MRRTNSDLSMLGYSYSQSNRHKSTNIPTEMRNLCSCDAARLSEELVTLRRTTKEALEVSWKETEEWRSKNEQQQEQISKLEEDLRKLKEDLEQSRGRENTLQQRNEKLLAKMSANGSGPFYKSVFSRTGSSRNLLGDPSLRHTIHTSRRHSMLASTKSKSTSQIFSHSLHSASSRSIASADDQDLQDLDYTTHSFPNSHAFFNGETFRDRQRKVSFTDALRDLNPTSSFHSTASTKDQGQPKSLGDRSVVSNTSSTSSFQYNSNNDPSTSDNQEATRQRPSLRRRYSNESFTGTEIVIEENPALEEKTMELQAKDEEIKMLKMKMKSRDDMIELMEDTMSEHIRTWQDQFRRVSGESDL